MAIAEQDISELTSDEISHLIFGGAAPDDYRAMPLWVAIQVVAMDHLDDRLKDWAWLVLAAEVDTA